MAVSPLWDREQGIPAERQADRLITQLPLYDRGEPAVSYRSMNRENRLLMRSSGYGCTG